MEQLQSKTALITGASRGIGRAIALRLARLGVTPLLSARRPEGLEVLATEMESEFGVRPTCISADLADEASVSALVAAVTQSTDTLDILINNAGMTFSGALEETPTQVWDRCLAVNARGPFILCRDLLSLLRRGSRPCIVNIASVVGIKGYAQQSAYTASKHALRGMSIALAEELQPEGIRVHVVCPGGVDTDMVSQVRPDIAREDLMQPEDVADAVVFLITRLGKGIVDEIRIRRESSAPWF